MSDKFENLYDNVHKSKYRPWMRKLILIAGLLFIVLASVLFILTYLKGTFVGGIILFVLAPLFIGIGTVFFSQKASDKLIAYMFGGY